MAPAKANGGKIDHSGTPPMVDGLIFQSVIFLVLLVVPADSGGLQVFDLSAGTWSALLGFHIGYPNWSHDSKYIYFDRFADPVGVGRVRVSDHSVESVVAPDRGDPLWSVDSWTGLTPDDEVLLVRDASLEEIYALRWRAR